MYGSFPLRLKKHLGNLKMTSLKYQLEPFYKKAIYSEILAWFLLEKYLYLYTVVIKKKTHIILLNLFVLDSFSKNKTTTH